MNSIYLLPDANTYYISESEISWMTDNELRLLMADSVQKCHRAVFDKYCLISVYLFLGGLSMTALLSDTGADSFRKKRRDMPKACPVSFFLYGSGATAMMRARLNS